MRQCKQQMGVVLIIVLVIMQILAMLSWYGMENILAENEKNKKLLLREHMFYTAKHVLSLLEISVEQKLPSCIVAENVKKPADFWESPAVCTGSIDQFNYHYVLEPLDSNACYYRLTLFFHSKNGSHQLYLQSVIFKEKPACAVLMPSIKSGRQSWCEL